MAAHSAAIPHPDLQLLVLMKSSASDRISNILWALAGLAIVLVAGYVAFTNLGHYNDGYDGGVYLESARLMDRGFPLYTSIFDSQAPLWLFLVDAGFKLGGESVRSGRLPTAAGFVVTVIALILAGREIRGRLTGLLAGALVLLSPFYLRFARLVEADVPCAAFAAVAIACAARYANVGRRRWLILAALALTASTLTKLLGIYTAPAIAVFILTRWASAKGGWRTNLGQILIDVGIVAGIFVAISLAFLLALGPGPVWNQVVTFHLVARGADYFPWSTHRALTLVSYLHLEPLLVPGLPLVILALTGRSRGAAVLFWAAGAAAGLVSQEPLQDHQVVTMIPPLALAIAFGWGQLWAGAVALARRVTRRSGRRAWSGAAGALVLLGIAGLAIFQLGRGVRPAWDALRALDAHSEENAINLRVAPIVLAHSTPSDYILTDQQSVANWLNRDVPPGLADTSFVRIDSGYLTADQVIDESTRFHVKMVVLESGRLTKLPKVVAWVKQTFPNQVDVGNGRVVYWR